MGIFRPANDYAGPADNAAAVVPSDATVLPRTRALYVAGTGDVKVDMRGAGTVTFTSVPAGSILPISVVKVYATGTTATGIVALY